MLVEANCSLARSRFVTDRPLQKPSGAPSRSIFAATGGVGIPRIGRSLHLHPKRGMRAGDVVA
jgi:hypothetical protein